MSDLTRRQFLKVTGTTLAASSFELLGFTPSLSRSYALPGSPLAFRP